jgi:hypothetical protein
MFQLKDGATIVGNKYTNLILKAVQIAMDGLGDVVVTAGRDGKHGVESYHYLDRALDIRFWQIAPDDRGRIAATIRTLLPPYFDVVVEATHFHIEADAKKEQRYAGGIA